MKIEAGKTYCGPDARPKTVMQFDDNGRNGKPEDAGLEGEWRQVISINGDTVMFIRRIGPPETMPLSEFEAWAVNQVALFLGRMAIV